MPRISTQFALFQEHKLRLAEGAAAFASCHVICKDVFYTEFFFLGGGSGVGGEEVGVVSDRGRQHEKYIGMFWPFSQRYFVLYFHSVPIYTVTLSSALSYTYTYVFFERIKKASPGLCGVFEETLCECLLPQLSKIQGVFTNIKIILSFPNINCLRKLNIC